MVTEFLPMCFGRPTNIRVTVLMPDQKIAFSLIFMIPALGLDRLL